MERPILTTFSTVMCLGLPNNVCQWNSQIWKYKMSTAAIFKNWKILISLQLLERFWRYLACWCASTFQDGGRPPYWIRLGHIWTTHSEYLLVTITLQNLVMIDAVVFIIWTFQYLTLLAGKCLFMPKKLFFLGGNLIPKMGYNINKSQKGTPLREYASF